MANTGKPTTGNPAAGKSTTGKSTTGKVSIVFCHGIWADASCFSKLIPALQADGHEVISVQYGLTTYAHDVAAVERTLKRVPGPVLLVGHSYGGATITGAGLDERVHETIRTHK